MATDSFNLTRLRRGIKPFRLYWFPRLRSTNDQAAVLRRRGELFAPAIVLTGHQTAGRGRGGSNWWSGRGCLTVTFALPVEEQLSAQQLPLVAGLAVRHAAAELTGTAGIQLKWPNDVVFEGRKLAGLLCERLQQADLIGVGLNVNLDPARAPRALRERITSLSHIAGRALDPTAVLVALAQHLHGMLARRRRQHPYAALLNEYDRHHSLNGRHITVQTNGVGRAVEGWCEGIDHMGRLLVREDGAVRRIVSGHVVNPSVAD